MSGRRRDIYRQLPENRTDPGPRQPSTHGHDRRDGRRYHHILDPKTGYPTQGPLGVTLVAEELEQVNGLGAAIMVLGAVSGRELITQTPGSAA